MLRGVLILVISTALMLGGCAHGPPAPVEDRTARAATIPMPPESLPSPDAGVTSAQPPTAPPADRPGQGAVESARSPTQQLLAAADVNIAAGRYDAAGASVERAMRLTPEDPVVWHKLAQLRFVQGDYRQAKATAERSNALPGASPRLLAANWFLIADIERINGNQTASAEAYAKAQRQLSALPRE